MKDKRANTILNSFLMSNKAIVIVILLSVVMSIISPNFLTSRNLMNVLRQVCVSTITAVGFCMILGSNHIDLSLGSTVAMTGVIMGLLMRAGCPIILAIFVGLVVGAAIGAINATIITVFKLPPFIVTMAMQQVLRGATYLITGMLPVTDLPAGFVWFGQGYIGGVPVPVYIMLIMVAAVWVIVNRTKFGRYLLAIGGNADAAYVSGINVNRVRLGVFVANSMCAVVASVVLTARSASAQPSAGLTMEMDAIAASVIGGTSMNGGSVNVVGAFFGALIVGIVNNGLNLLGIDSNWQTVSKGLLILVAVILDQVSRMMYEAKQNKNK